MFRWLSPQTDREPPRIRFLCEPDNVGVIAPPVQAGKAVPDWFKALPPVDRTALSARNNALTIKRCLPFIDALTIGWIIPLAASVRLEVSEGGTKVDVGWEFDQTMISAHNPGQVAGHPKAPSPPLKFHNHWTIVTPPGWSCLFLAPLNRPHPAFDVLAGIVDTDEYRSPVHFPFFPPAADGVYEIDQGTPIAQLIPFRRDASALALEAEIRAETDAEADERERIHRATTAGAGWYRTQARAPR